ncbi:hypothetical protein JW711_03350 [Candidatus Woesearchaeota archaeon]|nr:hypothetical protein [Candidatus Woesearchaeota archaeon]
MADNKLSVKEEEPKPTSERDLAFCIQDIIRPAKPAELERILRSYCAQMSKTFPPETFDKGLYVDCKTPRCEYKFPIFMPRVVMRGEVVYVRQVFLCTREILNRIYNPEESLLDYMTKKMGLDELLWHVKPSDEKT